jgi:hypothetical protein
MYLDCWTVGYEELWVAVAEEFRSPIHVSQQRYNMFSKVHSSFAVILTTDPTITRFHSCHWDEKCFVHEDHMVSIHPTPHQNNKPYEFYQSRHSKLLQTDLPYNCKPKIQMV